MLIIGRLLFGFCSGLLTVATPRFVQEYVPMSVNSVFSSLFPFAQTVGIFIGVLSAAILPPDDADFSDLKGNKTWRLIFGFPFLACLIL